MHLPRQLLNRALLALAGRLAPGTRTATTTDTAQVQAHALRRILARTRGTHFASDYGLRGDEDPDTYRQFVPVFDDEDLAPLWQRAERGERNVFSRDPVLGFALSAGTTGDPKRVPLTRHLLHALRALELHALAAHVARRPDSRLLLRHGLAIAGRSQQEVTAGGAPCGVLSGLAIRLLPAPARMRVVPDLDVLDDPDWDRKLDRTVEAAKGRRIGSLGGIPANILDFLRRARKKLPSRDFRRLVEDVELVLSSGVAFARYRDEIESLLDNAPDVVELYTATEGAYGIQAEPHRAVFSLLPERLFFEFVPEAAWDAQRRDASLLLHQLEAGARYVPLVTNGSGAFRYPIGDRLECVRAGPSPHFALRGRLSLTLNLVGEKTHAAIVQEVVSDLAAELGSTPTAWTVTGHSDGDAPHYEWILPAEAAWRNQSAEKLAKRVDDLTARHHDRYRAHRAQRLGPPRVHLVEPDRLEDWAARHASDAGHRKMPPILEDHDELAELLHAAPKR